MFYKAVRSEHDSGELSQTTVIIIDIVQERKVGLATDSSGKRERAEGTIAALKMSTTGQSHTLAA